MRPTGTVPTKQKPFWQASHQLARIIILVNNNTPYLQVQDEKLKKMAKQPYFYNKKNVYKLQNQFFCGNANKKKMSLKISTYSQKGRYDPFSQLIIVLSILLHALR